MKLCNIKPLFESVGSFKGIAKDKQDLVNSIVNGYFTLDGRKLKSTTLWFGGKGLKSLVGMPTLTNTENVNVFVGSNELTSLEGCPNIINGSFRCSNNKLKTLKGGPEAVSNAYIASQNELVSMLGAAQKVGAFIASQNKIVSLEFCPRIIEQTLGLSNNKITSLIGVNKFIDKFLYNRGQIDLTNNPIKEGGLGLLLIPGLMTIAIDNISVQEIINKYLKIVINLPINERHKQVLNCQSELLDADLDEYAQL